MKNSMEYSAAFIVGVIEGVILWVALIILKAAGVVTAGWHIVMGAFVPLACLMFALAAMTSAIIRQAKAAGVWNTNAGGRALELYAKECGVKKYAGETDAHLRVRIKEAAERGGVSHGA